MRCKYTKLFGKFAAHCKFLVFLGEICSALQNTIVLCIQVRIVAVGVICPSCIIVTKLNLKHWPRMNEST